MCVADFERTGDRHRTLCVCGSELSRISREILQSSCAWWVNKTYYLLCPNSEICPFPRAFSCCNPSVSIIYNLQKLLLLKCLKYKKMIKWNTVWFSNTVSDTMIFLCSCWQWLPPSWAPERRMWLWWLITLYLWAVKPLDSHLPPLAGSKTGDLCRPTPTHL